MREKKHLNPNQLNIVLIVGAVIFIAVIAVSLKVYSLSHTSSSTDEAPIPVTSEQIKSQIIEDEIKIVQGSSSAVVEIIFMDQVPNSNLICVANYIGQSDSFMIDPAGTAEPALFTDFYFKISQVIAGSPASTDGETYNLVVRQKVGEGNYIKQESDVAATFEEGASYLLALYQINDGSFYNTEGSHYYLTADNQSCWKWDGEAYINEKSNERLTSLDLSNQMINDELGRERDQYPASTAIEELESLRTQSAVDEEYFQNIIAEESAKRDGFSRIMSEDLQAKYEETMVSVAKMEIATRNQ